VLLVLYVLSTGPVEWLSIHGYIEPRGIIIYRPLDAVLARNERLFYLHQYYLGLFEDD
jgi:hypothetical protein